MEITQNEYDMELQKTKYKNYIAYVLANLLKGVFYIAKLFLKVIWGGVKGVLQTFGVPIK